MVKPHPAGAAASGAWMRSARIEAGCLIEGKAALAGMAGTTTD